MKLAMIPLVLLLTACVASGADPAFKDVQRWPPVLSKASALNLIRNERQLAEWIVETRKKCEALGCTGPNQSPH